MTRIFFTILAIMFFSSSSFADGHGLPKSGTINWVTGWIFDTSATAPQKGGYVLGSGRATGATFNVNGSGPLHEGRAVCIAVFIAMPDGSGTNKGNCYFGDKDGDRIITSFTGDIVAFKGDNTIIGGSGKYEGITGSGLWECDGSGEADDSAFNCRQNLTYKLP